MKTISARDLRRNYPDKRKGDVIEIDGVLYEVGRYISRDDAYELERLIDNRLRLFYCVDHDGYYYDGRRNTGLVWNNAAEFEDENGNHVDYPFAVCTVIVATDEESAREWLDEKLIEMGLKEYEYHPYTLHEISLTEENISMLLIGDYGKSCIEYMNATPGDIDQ